jgi:hypothetical protein
MKKLVLLLFLTCLTFQTIHSQCTREAPFQNGPDYDLAGSAALTYLLDGTKTLSFDNEFSTSAGPDLHVYLSKSAIISTPNGVLETPNTIDLGLLQSPNGSQFYDLTGINSSVDLDSYDYVIIHCKEYNHYWGTGSFGVPFGADCGSLFVANLERGLVIIYPTLIKNKKFTIELKNQQKTFLNMYSVLGELVQKPLILTEKINIINVGALKSGIYILQLDSGSGTRAQKIIIE